MSIYDLKEISLHRLKFLGDKTFNFCKWYSRNRKIEFCHPFICPYLKKKHPELP